MAETTRRDTQNMRQAGDGGFVLPAVIGTLVILGLLITAGFHVAEQELRIGIATEKANLAFYLADNGVADVLENWDYSAMGSIPIGSESTLVDTLSYGDWEINVRRIGTKTFLLTAASNISEGGSILAGASRNTGTIVRVLGLDVEPPAVLTTTGDLNYNGSSPPVLSGLDQVPSGWGAYCSAPLLDQIGFLSDDSSSVMIDDSGSSSGSGGSGKGKGKGKGSGSSGKGSGGKSGSGGNGQICVSQVTGSPCSRQSSTLVAEAMASFEGQSWTDLIAMASHTITAEQPGTALPVDASGECTVSASMNWGDPLNPADPCGGYFPMIYFNPGPGNETRLAGSGRGQGIFLFEEDFRIQGSYQLYGLVVVNGSIKMRGTSKIMGAIIAGSTSGMNGTPDALYSSCAVDRAIYENSSLSRARPLTNRSFIDLSNLIGN